MLNVAFAGHNRPEDLGDPDEAEAGLDAAFRLLCTVSPTEMRLFTGLAEGDYAAARAWRRACTGTIHAVYPYLDMQPPADIAALAGAETRLDGAALDEVGRNPHLAQSRWLIGAADLLVVVWNGEAGRGAGGTADAVWLALEQNLPVLWYKPGDPGKLRLIRSEEMEDGFGFLEFLEQLKRDIPPLVIPADELSLRGALVGAATSPDSLQELDPGADPAASPLDPLLRRTLWRSYANFRKLLGGRPAPGPPPTPIPDDLQAQAGFKLMTDAFHYADGRANRLSAAHRSQQLLLLGLAIVAAATGSLPDLNPDLKIWAVLGELVLGLSALGAWSAATRATRHERWGRSRRLAEQLRLERVCWALGVSTVVERSNSGAGPAAGAARHVRRLAGIPTGNYDPDRVRVWGGWAMDEMVRGQAAYHHGQGGLNHRISHRMHRFEDFTFLAFIFVLASFAIAYFTLLAFGGHHMPPWVGGAVEMMGAVVPAFGAASLAMEATLAFSEQAYRSHLLADKLHHLADMVTPDSRLDQLQLIAKTASRLQMEQEDRWTQDTVRQSLMRGG